MALLIRRRIAPATVPWRVLAVVLAVAAAFAVPRSLAAPPAANQVKAAFLCNFADFVQWPEGHDGDGPVVIGILGEDPFGPHIDEAAESRSLPAHEIGIRRLESAEEATEVAILFISASEAAQLDSVLESLRYEAVLTVSDIPGFAAHGGIVGLKVEDKRVRLEINVGAAARAGLVVSSRLLNLATLVDDADGEGS